MIVKTKIFELFSSNYQNLSQLAEAMGISVSQIYRVRQGKRNINQKFIVGAIRAFPGYRFEDLFHFALEMPTVTSKPRHASSTKYPQREKRKKQAVELHNVLSQR